MDSTPTEPKMETNASQEGSSIPQVQSEPVAAPERPVPIPNEQEESTSSAIPALNSTENPFEASNQITIAPINPIQESTTTLTPAIPHIGTIRTEDSGSIAEPKLAHPTQTANVTMNYVSIDEDDTKRGGRLWKMAGERAKASIETFLPKSRAEPYYEQDVPQNVCSVQNDEDAVFSFTADSSKRPVQLLLAGLLGLLAWVSNFYVQTSCHFATVSVPLGQYSDLDLHYGLWKYSPADSAIAGYTYCYPYQNTKHIPVLPRLTNLIALFAGTWSVVILWWYLIFSVPKYWKTSIYACLVAAACQTLTLFFFVGRLCRQYDCQMGTGSTTCIFSSLSWCLLAFLLWKQTPKQEDTTCNTLLS